MKTLVLLSMVVSGALCSCSPLRAVDRVSDEVLRNSQINHSLELIALENQDNNEFGERPFVISSQKKLAAVASRHTLIGTLYPIIAPDEYRECLLPFAEALIYAEESDVEDDASSSTALNSSANLGAINSDVAQRTSLSFRSVEAVISDDLLLHPQYQNELTEIIGYIQQLDTQPQYYRLGAVRTLPDDTITAPLFVANNTSYTTARIVCVEYEQQWHVSGFAINIYDLAENLFDTLPTFTPHSNRNSRSGLLP